MDAKTRTEIFVLNTLTHTHIRDDPVEFICIALGLLGINRKLMKVALIVLASEGYGSFLSAFIYLFLHCYVSIFAVKSGAVS